MRPLAAWVAVLGLYLQLVAGALCLGGSAPGAAIGDGGRVAWPICHAQAAPDNGSPSDPGGHTPSHPQACAFCLVHCLGGLAAAPVVRLAAPVPVLTAPGRIAVAVVRPLSRVPTDAAPRGPPTIG